MARIMVGAHLDGLVTGAGDFQVGDLAGAVLGVGKKSKGKVGKSIRHIIKNDRRIAKESGGKSFLAHPKAKHWQEHMGPKEIEYVKALKRGGGRRKGKQGGAAEDDDSEGVGDLAMLPVWTAQDRETWEPHGLGDFRTAEVYSGTGRRQHYTGEALPFMVGGHDDEAGLFGSKKRREAAKAEAAASEGLAYVGNLASVGDLPRYPAGWTEQDPAEWEPRGIGDFRTNQIYSRTGFRRHYRGEQDPQLVGDIDAGYRDAWRPQGVGDPPDYAVYEGDAIPYMEGVARAAASEGLVYLGNIRR